MDISKQKDIAFAEKFYLEFSSPHHEHSDVINEELKILDALMKNHKFSQIFLTGAGIHQPYDLPVMKGFFTEAQKKLDQIKPDEAENLKYLSPQNLQLLMPQPGLPKITELRDNAGFFTLLAGLGTVISGYKINQPFDENDFDLESCMEFLYHIIESKIGEEKSKTAAMMILMQIILEPDKDKYNHLPDLATNFNKDNNEQIKETIAPFTEEIYDDIIKLSRLLYIHIDDKSCGNFATHFNGLTEKLKPTYFIEFTTNYDTIIEKTFETGRLNTWHFTDGISDEIFSFQNFSKSNSKKPFWLFKLHGSVDRIREGNKIIKLNRIDQILSEGKDSCIDKKKISNTGLVPPVISKGLPDPEEKPEMFLCYCALCRFLKKADTCIVIGSSLRDNFLRNILRAALKYNKKLKIIGSGPSKSKGFEELEINNNERVSFIDNVYWGNGNYADQIVQEIN